MKKISLLLLVTSLAFSAHSQVRLNAYGNYVFDDGVDSYYSNTDYFNGTIKGGFLWGAGLEYGVNDYYGIELLYNRLDTHAPVEYYDNSSIGNNIKNADIDLGLSYIMIGGVRYMKPHDKVDPYGGFLLGMAVIDAHNPVNGNSNSSTKFAWGMRLGTNIWASDRVGVKLQAQILSIPQGSGGSLYFGTGGAGAGISTYSTMLQFVLGGGLTFKLGGQSKSSR